MSQMRLWLNNETTIFLQEYYRGLPMFVYMTGCNGYLGGWVTQKLEELGYRIKGYDSHGNHVYSTKNKQWKLDNRSGIEIADTVISLGWYTTVGDKYPELQIESQERTCQLVDNLIKSKNQKTRFIFASSAAVYGNSGHVLMDEESATFANCAYSKAKLKTENYIREYLPNRYNIFRFGSLMGLGMEGYRTKTELVVNAFAVDGYKRKLIKVWNPQSNKPVLHVQDAADLIVDAVNGMIYTGVYNACIGSYPASAIASDIARLTGASLDIVKPREGQENSAKSCMMSCAKLRNTASERVARFKTYLMAAHEFEKYIESPTDKNSPWEKVK